MAMAMSISTQENRVQSNGGGGGGGGCSPCLLQPKNICRAWKEMKTKVATHTGVSLSFVELVSTSPAVGLLLPALPASPRSPSAVLHRRMLQINGRSQHINELQNSMQQSVQHAAFPPPSPSRAPQSPRRSSAKFSPPAASPVLRHHTIVTRLAVFLLSIIARLAATARCFLGRVFRRNKREVITETEPPPPSPAPPVSARRQLKTKLRSSFKTLSVQVPRKAFAPLHLNTPSSQRSPSLTPSSLASPLSTPSLSSVSFSSPSPSTARHKTPFSVSGKSRSFYTASPTQSPSPLFLNQSQSHTLAMAASMPRKAKLNHNKPRKSSIVAGFISVVLALAGLHVSKIVAGVVVVVWLLILTISVSLSVRVNSLRAATCT